MSGSCIMAPASPTKAAAAETSPRAKAIDEEGQGQGQETMSGSCIMAPKLAMKKFKAKGKSRGKAKAKGKAKVRKVVVAEAAAGDGQIMAVPEKQPKEKSLAGPLRKKVQDLLKLKSVEEALADAEAELAATNQRIEEAAQIVEQQDEACKAAKHGFEEIKGEVENAMAEEMKAAAALKSAKDTKSGQASKTQEKRAELQEVQKKLMMLDVMASVFKSKSMAEEATRKAKEANEQAKKAFQEQRQQEKEALEATKRSLQEAKQKRLSQAKEASAVKEARTEPVDQQET